MSLLMHESNLRITNVRPILTHYILTAKHFLIFFTNFQDYFPIFKT